MLHRTCGESIRPYLPKREGTAKAVVWAHWSSRWVQFRFVDLLFETANNKSQHRGHNNPQIELTLQSEKRRGAMKLNQCRHLGRSGWLRRVEGGGSGGGKGRKVG